MNEPAAIDWDVSAYRRIRRTRDAILSPLSSRLAGGGVPATVVSLLGVGLAASVYVSLGRSLTWAAAAFLGALVCDAVDGAVARRSGSSSAVGKWIDHACDTATFLLVLASIARWELADLQLSVTAGALALPLLPLAVYVRSARRRVAEPEGGATAHLHKVPIYAALLLHLLGGPNFIDGALGIAIGIAFACLLALLAGIALARPVEARKGGCGSRVQCGGPEEGP